MKALALVLLVLTYELASWGNVSGNKDKDVKLRIRPEGSKSRDGSLQGLLALFEKHSGLFDLWLQKRLAVSGRGDENGDVDPPNKPSSSSAGFLALLAQWIGSEPTVPLSQVPEEGTAHADHLDCANSAMQGVLMGKRIVGQPRMLVDFVPFGYDVDALEIRFLETFDLVDLFVVYESPRTLTAHPKPYFLRELRSTPRFHKWFESGKVLYIPAAMRDIAREAKKTRAARGKVNRQKAWALEASMRHEIVEEFNKVLAKNFSTGGVESSRGADSGDSASGLPRGSGSRHRATVSKLRGTLASLSDATSGHQHDVLGIQNDEDELVSRHSLVHMKYCQLKPEVKAVYAPAFSFKKNYHWVQSTHDMSCLAVLPGSSDSTIDLSPLKSFLWRPGPYLWPLQEMLKRQNTLRLRTYVLESSVGSRSFECVHHLGLGSAVHMSSTADPGIYWFKRFGVVEQSHVGAVSDALLLSASSHNLTAAAIYNAAVQPWCSEANRAVHVDSLAPVLAETIRASIPRAVLANPDRYPFLLPGKTTAPFNAAVRKYAQPSWHAVCDATANQGSF